MILGKFSKQPYEEFYFGANFANVIDTDNESIVLGSSSVTAVDQAGVTTTDVYYSGTLVVLSSTILAVKVKAGEVSGSPYKFSYRVVTSLGNKYEKDLHMEIFEV